MSWDRTALQVAASLQKDNTKSLDRIAEEIGSSRSAVQRRVRRLRDAGVIRGDVALIDARRMLGLETFIIDMQLRTERSDLTARFVRTIRALNEVQQCYLTTGRWNCGAIVLLPDARAFDAFALAHLADDPSVRRYKARLVVRDVKISLSVPVGEGGNEADAPTP